MANGYSAPGYGLAIHDEKDKSSMGYEIGAKNPKRGGSVYVEISTQFTYAVKKLTRDF